MYKKELAYKDYNGNDRLATLWFNLNQIELVDMEVDKGPRGIVGYLEEIQKTDNRAEAVKYIKELIRNSYGIKTEDGSRFVKSDDIWNEFAQTAAYPAMFSLLATNPIEMEAFVNGVVPEGIREQFPVRKDLGEQAETYSMQLATPTTALGDTTEVGSFDPAGKIISRSS